MLEFVKEGKVIMTEYDDGKLEGKLAEELLKKRKQQEEDKHDTDNQKRSQDN